MLVRTIPLTTPRTARLASDVMANLRHNLRPRRATAKTLEARLSTSVPLDCHRRVPLPTHSTQQLKPINFSTFRHKSAGGQVPVTVPAYAAKQTQITLLEDTIGGAQAEATTAAPLLGWAWLLHKPKRGRLRSVKFPDVSHGYLWHFDQTINLTTCKL